jgi:hypothetical protein
VKKFLLILLLIFMICPVANIAVAQRAAEQDSTPPKKDRHIMDRLYIGGNVGLLFGSTTLIELSPQVGYRLTDRFVPGIGITYIYQKYKDAYYSYENSVYGGSLFAKYFFTEKFFSHVEYEMLNVEYVPDYGPYITPTIGRKWISSFYVGGGYSQPLGERGFAQIMILFELIQDPWYPYYRSNPIIKIGFGF